MFGRSEDEAPQCEVEGCDSLCAPYKSSGKTYFRKQCVDHYNQENRKKRAQRKAQAAQGQSDEREEYIAELEAQNEALIEMVELLQSNLAMQKQIMEMSARLHRLEGQ